ncbi:MAG: hypothetical protein HY851_11170 [candidate division Zixibacteria bacterium]|nr:hypothetical protein [candidate division Zixibacteria bacterium]
MARHLLAIICLVAGGATSAAAASEPIRYALCDLRVVYLYDDPAAIDWATIYYLNDEKGCRVDLVTATSGPTFQVERRSVDDKYLVNWQCTMVAGDSARFDSVFAHVWADRRPDLIINDLTDTVGATGRLAKHISSLKPLTGSLFNIVRIFSRTEDADKGIVSLNSREWYTKCRIRIEAETPRLMGESYAVQVSNKTHSRYRAVMNGGGPDFLSKLRQSRLIETLDSLMKPGAVRQALERKAGNSISLLEVAQTQSGRARLRSVVSAWQELVGFRDAAAVEPTLKVVPEFGRYTDSLVERIRRLALVETGVNWTGDIVVRDSPYGPKVKLVSTVMVTGPSEVRISEVSFRPSWDSTTVTLDSMRETVNPHQSLVREYLVDISRQRLESVRADSLRFAIEMDAGGLPMMMYSAVPVRRTTRLAARFEPNFYFVQPFAALNVDKVVTSMALRVVISKPLEISGRVKINLETPTGVFAGAYRQDITLEKGQATETIRIPFSVSKLFELGIQNMVVSLSMDGRLVSSDTGIIRLASCHVEDTTAIGLLPDTTGHLEDILRMTDAKWQAVSDRTLEVGDLAAFDVLLIGSGALDNYPSFRKVRGRLEDYVHGGGTIIIMGQPSSWPSEALPVSFVPTPVVVSGSTVHIVDPAHDLFRKGSPILTSGLLTYFDRPTKVSGAVISPTRPLITGPRSEILLSVTSVGNGKLVFCGLPLTDMVGKLNVEAIHLLANILNY